MKYTRFFAFAGIVLFAGFVFVFNAPSADAAPLSGVNADMDQVAYDNGGVFTGYTTAANEVTTNDVPVCGASVNDALYLGMTYIFDQIAVKYDTACAGGHAGVWEYYNGSSWGSLTVTDNTTGFETTATTTTIDITSIPSDWATVDPDAGGGVTSSAYFIRFRTTTGDADVVGGSQFSAQEFNLKLHAQDELGTAITGLADGAFTITGGTDNTKFSFREISAGDYELALDTAGGDVTFDYTVQKDGYVTTGTATTGAMTTALTDITGTPAALDFAYKVTTITTEVLTADITNSVTTFVYGDGTGTNACTKNAAVWYCPVVTANSDGTMTTTVTLDGYVEKAYAPASAATRANNGIGQVSTTVTGIEYSHKLTVTSDTPHGGFAVTGATVTNDLGVSPTVFTESGSTGVYYGAVPFGNDNKTVTITKTGWTDNTGTTSGDRAANGTAQQAQTNTTLAYIAITSLATPVPGLNLSVVNLSWTVSADTADFSEYEIYSRILSGVTNSNGTLFSQTSNSALATRTTTAVDVTGLSCGKVYYFTIYAIDGKTNRSTLATEVSKATASCPASDTSSPGDITNFVATDATTGGTINLSWTNPSDADFSKVHIHRGATSEFTPTDNNEIALIAGTASGTSSYTDTTDLVNGTMYYYRARTEDTNSNVQSGLFYPTASATPTAPVEEEEPTTPVGRPETGNGSVEASPGLGGKTFIDTAANARAQVELPAQAVDRATTITVSPVALATVIAATSNVPFGKTVVGSEVFDFSASADGVEVKNFNKAVALTFTFTAGQVEGLDINSLKVYFYDANAGAWMPLPSVVDVENNTVTADTTHFTYFAIFGDPIILDGDLLSTADSFDIYLVKLVGTKKFKRLILNPAIFESYGHLRWDAVKTVTQELQDSYTMSDLVIEVNADGSVADPKVYQLSSSSNSDFGQRQWLNMSPVAFEARGYDWDAIYKINHTEASADFYPTGDSITAS